MANLVPEVRVDKNGKSVVRHVRPANNEAGKKRIPSPTTGKSKPRTPSASDVLQLIAERDMGKPAALRNWIEQFTPHQLGVLHEALLNAETADHREKELIKRALFFSSAAFARDTFHEKIALRDAFSGSWRRDSIPPLVDANACIYATRRALNGDVEQPIDLEDEVVRKKAEAFLRFMFEARYHFSETSYPLVYQVSANGKEVERFVMEEFNSLVLDHSDRVHELLTLIDDRQTTDAHLLRELMEHDGPSAVSSGYL